MIARRNPFDDIRIGALIAAIVLAKVLMPGQGDQGRENRAGPVVIQPAPVYVKTIRALERVVPEELPTGQDV
ncbi:hypothetical protein [Pseudophaeobacter sp.]|uniref:hypothetical protein n=1 Tax=Pseudophaeobacter sp. TaxID=1971739 RepID=UPI0032977F3D